ncbi:MAG: hypothetical protein IJT25_00935 [Clostridia bacterium]|nr:hypothetical protein [Clostridia bacterium]
MEAKNTGAVLATIFFIIVCAIIGSSFMAFVYAEKKVVINDPKVIISEGITVLNSKQERTTNLVLSKAVLGLKPATGKEDAITHIPFTITDTVGTEGQYSKFYVKAETDYDIYVINTKIEGGESGAEDERKHICVGIKNEKETTKTLEDNKVLLYSGTKTDEIKELTLFVWLHAHAGNSLAGAKISFDIAVISK